MHENPDYEDVIARAKGFKRVPAHWLDLVIPVAFITEHKKMLWEL
jgi:hypothetical protein